MTEITAIREEAQYVTLTIDKEIFAIDVEQVREILDMQPLSKLPRAPEFLAGMIDVRGKGVPVIDLRLKLGLVRAETTENTRIVVIEIPVEDRHHTIGMIADRVIEVTSLSEHGLESAPDIGIRWKSDYIRAVGRSRGAFAVVLDLGHLFTAEDVALVDEAR